MIKKKICQEYVLTDEYRQKASIDIETYEKFKIKKD